MLEFLSTPLAQIVIYVAAVAVMTAFAYYLLQKFRGQSDHDTVTPNEQLTNYRELHAKGDISEEEYRTIKSVLGEQLREQLKNDDNDS